MKKSFIVYGKVQGVMFRQTFIQGLLKRKLSGGATNNNDPEKTVSITIEGNKKEIETTIADLKIIKVINSWNASIENIKEHNEIIEFDDHQVTTENVDQFKWSSGVEFYF